MASTVIYTAIFGKYDGLLEVPHEQRRDDVDYICFTDDPSLRSDSFHVVVWPISQRCPSRENRDLKINGLRYLADYERSIYIDGNQQITGCLTDLFVNLDDEKSGLAVFRHSKNNCAYAEAEAVIHRGQDKKSTVLCQMDRYSRAGFPKNYGLGWNGLLVRYHTAATRTFCDYWYREVNQHSFRDQLSLMYVSWKRSGPLVIIEDDSLKSKRSKFVRAVPHIGKRNASG